MNDATRQTIQTAVRKARHALARASDDVESLRQQYAAAVHRRQAAAKELDELEADALAEGIDITPPPPSPSLNQCSSGPPPAVHPAHR